jgi:hypothetical protein
MESSCMQQAPTGWHLDSGDPETILIQGLFEELALLRDMRTAEAQVARGRVRPHATVAKRLRSKLVK